MSSEQGVGTTCKYYTTTTLLTFQCAGRHADVFIYTDSWHRLRALLSPEGVAALSRVTETFSEEDVKALRQRRPLKKLEGAAAAEQQAATAATAALAEQERLAALPPQCVNFQPQRSGRVRAKNELTQQLPELSHPVKDLRPEDLLPEGYAIASYETGKCSSTDQLFKVRSPNRRKMASANPAKTESWRFT